MLRAILNVIDAYRMPRRGNLERQVRQVHIDRAWDALLGRAWRGR